MRKRKKGMGRENERRKKKMERIKNYVRISLVLTFYKKGQQKSTTEKKMAYRNANQI